jgi:hypothetical protein
MSKSEINNLLYDVIDTLRSLTELSMEGGLSENEAIALQKAIKNALSTLQRVNIRFKSLS